MHNERMSTLIPDQKESISEDKIDEFRPAMRNLLGLIRGRVFYNINNWYKGLTLLPGFGRNKSDMEKMMGLEDLATLSKTKYSPLVKSSAGCQKSSRPCGA